METRRKEGWWRQIPPLPWDNAGGDFLKLWGHRKPPFSPSLCVGSGTHECGRENRHGLRADGCAPTDAQGCAR